MDLAASVVDICLLTVNSVLLSQQPFILTAHSAEALESCVAVKAASAAEIIIPSLFRPTRELRHVSSPTHASCLLSGGSCGSCQDVVSYLRMFKGMSAQDEWV